MSLARELVRAARAASSTPLPEDVATAARLHLLDAIGVGLAAAGSPIGAAYRGFAAEVVKGGPATVFGQSTGAGAADAALINGGLIHSLEFDDTHTASIAHGSAVLAAGALAVAEAQNASGAALLGAYARGWEVLIRFGLAAPNGFHAKGFMSTSVTGALAVALLAAELMQLDEDRTRGGDRHRAQPGIRRDGISHQRLVGQIAPSRLGGARRRGGGDARALGDDGAGDFARRKTRALPPVHRRRSRRRALPRLDRRHRPRLAPAQRGVQVLSVLPLPASVHRGGGQAGRARRARGRRRAHPLPRAARRSGGHLRALGNASRRPHNGHAARWSLPIAVAAQLVEGKVDLATFEAPASPAVRELARRIAWEPLPQARFPERFEAEVVCNTKRGASETVRIDDVFGNHTRPPGAEAVLAKFRANAARSLKEDSVGALERATQQLGGARDLKALSTALRGIKSGTSAG